MKLLIQRVLKANVLVEGRSVGAINQGALVFIGIHQDDTAEQVAWLIQKLIHLRMFPHAEKQMDRSLLDIQGEILVVSQFTLYGSCKAGRRPEFTQAAPPHEARLLYDHFVEELKKEGLKVETGIFGADMQVSLINDGPVTLILSHP